MEILGQLPSFLLAVLVIAAVPGPAVALLIRRCSVGGVSAGVPIIAGLELGLYFWILAAGAGLAALLAASHTAYLVVRLAGAAVLTVLGIQAWRAVFARRRSGDPTAVDLATLPAAKLTGRGRRGGFAIGLLTNGANPKAAVFAFAFYPQFIPHGYPFALTAAALGLLQITLEFGFYLLLAALISQTRRWIGRSRVRRTIDAVSGTVLIGLGLRVATEQP
ncbi:MAG TPA: LysE family translocator [Mycobacteriales bacterium]|jgi:threonine/homoserine/homoserine lactone efflux protein|nr:LysE family translocator [Mycobacteriales bacterium]